MCKEMPVIPVSRVVDPKRIIRKNGGLRRRKGTRGCRPKKQNISSVQRKQCDQMGRKQGCQMAYFQTKNPDFGKFWRVLQWKMLVNYIRRYVAI
jgi:hypothetical protein